MLQCKFGSSCSEMHDLIWAAYFSWLPDPISLRAEEQQHPLHHQILNSLWEVHSLRGVCEEQQGNMPHFPPCMPNMPRGGENVVLDLSTVSWSWLPSWKALDPEIVKLELQCETTNFDDKSYLTFTDTWWQKSKPIPFFLYYMAAFV